MGGIELGTHHPIEEVLIPTHAKVRVFNEQEKADLATIFDLNPNSGRNGNNNPLLLPYRVVQSKDNLELEAAFAILFNNLMAYKSEDDVGHFRRVPKGDLGFTAANTHSTWKPKTMTPEDLNFERNMNEYSPRATLAMENFCRC